MRARFFLGSFRPLGWARRGGDLKTRTYPSAADTVHQQDVKKHPVSGETGGSSHAKTPV